MRRGDATSAVFLTAEAAAILTGAVAGPFLSQAVHFTGVATAASLATITAAALTLLTVPPGRRTNLAPGQAGYRTTSLPG